VKKFVSNHTKENDLDPYTTRRNSKTTPFHWARDFKEKYEEVREIQFACNTVMSLWGYKMANNASHMLTFNPLGEPPWPEMRFNESRWKIE